MKRRRAMFAQVVSVLGAKRRGDAGNVPEQALGHHFARWLLVSIVLVNIVAASSLWIIGGRASADHASSDLIKRVSAIQTLMEEGGLLEIPQFSHMRAQVAAAEADLSTLRSTVLFNGYFDSPAEARQNRDARIAADFLGAIENVLNAYATIQPSVTALLVSAIGATPRQAGNGLQSSQSTVSALFAVRKDVANAQAQWQEAWAELHALGTALVGSAKDTQTSSINTITQYMINTAYQLNTAFAAAVAVLNTLPFLLGISNPDHFLLLYLDPNQLTPTGGMATSYATIAISGGKVVSRIQFQSTLALDCAHTCVKNGLSLLDLAPDFITRAGHTKVALMNEAGINVHGVMAINANLIGNMLAILGPVPVPELGTTISAGNLLSENANYDQRLIALHARQARGAPADASRFSIALMNAVTRALAHASHDKLLRIGATLLHALTTKDLLVYTDYYSIEQQLTALDISGSVFETTRDSLYVQDADMGGDFNRGAIAETISDKITLNPKRMAIHALSITYTYAATDSRASPYHNRVQVIVPSTASAMTVVGPCATKPISVPYHSALACDLMITPGASATVSISWSYPLSGAAIAARHYDLLLQRQPGAQVAMNISLAPAKGISLLPASAAERASRGQVVWSASPLRGDTVVSAQLRGVG